MNNAILLKFKPPYKDWLLKNQKLRTGLYKVLINNIGMALISESGEGKDMQSTILCDGELICVYSRLLELY